MTSKVGRRGRGRPRHSDPEFVLAYFNAQLAAGHSVSAAAKAGLTILSREDGSMGKSAHRLVRRGQALEKLFRADEEAFTPYWLRADFVGEPPTFNGRPLPRPLILGPADPRKKGRPSKRKPSS